MPNCQSLPQKRLCQPSHLVALQAVVAAEVAVVAVVVAVVAVVAVVVVSLRPSLLNSLAVAAAVVVVVALFAVGDIQMLCGPVFHRPNRGP